MRFARFVLAAASLLVVPAASHAQQIEAGFSRKQVEARLGPPAAVRTVGEYTYLFYNNGCEIKCGQHDIVTMRGDKVTDAVLRGKGRTFGGKSSSPKGTPHQATPPASPAKSP